MTVGSAFELPVALAVSGVAAGVDVVGESTVLEAARSQMAGTVSQATSLLSAHAGYRVGSHSRVVVELFNLLNETASDIDYFYTSRLRNEPAAGIADVHTHPARPRGACDDPD